MTVGNYSRNPQTAHADAVQKGYTRVRFQQGKPILDRELNLAADLAAPNRLLSRYLGNGVPEGSDGFNIGTVLVAADDFTIQGGRCLVNGYEVTLASDTSYKNQPHKERVIPLPKNVLNYVYLRVFPVEVNEAQDTDLRNAGDIGFETALRERVDWEVLLASSEVTTPDHFPLAYLIVTGGREGPPPSSEDMLKFVTTEGLSAEKMVTNAKSAKPDAKDTIAKKTDTNTKFTTTETTPTPVPEDEGPIFAVFDTRLTGLSLRKVREDLDLLMDARRTSLRETSVGVRQLNAGVVQNITVTLNGGQSTTVVMANSAHMGVNPWLLLSIWGTGQFSWTERIVNNERILAVTNLSNLGQAVVNVATLKLF
jgi:hypothetical protein